MCQSDNSEAAVALRPMEMADVAFLTTLWVASWREAMPDIDFEGRRDWLARFLADRTHKTMVAEGSDGLCGFVTLEANHLHQLVVASHAKGTGLAAHVLNEAKSMSPAELTLDVNQANTRAVGFYRREGFAIESAATNPTSGLATWRMVWRRP